MRNHEVFWLQDMEALLHAQKRAEKDPLGFVESLKNGVS